MQVGDMEDLGNGQKHRYGLAYVDGRKHPRYTANFLIEYWQGTGANITAGHTGNISEGGLMAFLSEPIDIGQMLRLKIHCVTPNHKRIINTIVQVLRADARPDKDGDYRIATKIVEISPEDLDRFREILNDMQLPDRGAPPTAGPEPVKA